MAEHSSFCYYLNIGRLNVRNNYHCRVQSRFLTPYIAVSTGPDFSEQFSGPFFYNTNHCCLLTFLPIVSAVQVTEASKDHFRDVREKLFGVLANPDIMKPSLAKSFLYSSSVHYCQ